MSNGVKPYVQISQSRRKKKSNWRKWIWTSVIIIIPSIIVYLEFPEWFHKKTTSPIVLADEERLVPGLIIPDELQIPTNEIAIQVGTTQLGYGYQQLANEVDMGLEVHLVMCENHSCLPSVRLRIINNRLYIQDSIKSLEDKHLIGFLNYDKFELNRDEYYKCNNCDEQNLEIIDNNVTLL